MEKFTMFSAAEARLVRLMPPDTGPQPPEAERLNKEAAEPQFNIENTEATAKTEVARATQDQLQAKTKLITAALTNFNTGLTNFKNSYEKQIKQATEDGDADLASKLTAERDQRVTKIVADVNARLTELSNTQGYPSYQVVERGGVMTLVAGPEGRVDVQQALRNVPEGLKKRIMNLPPAEQEVFARTLNGMTPEQVNAAAPTLESALKTVSGMTPAQVELVRRGLLDSNMVSQQNLNVLVKTRQLTQAQANQVKDLFASLDANPPARDMLRRHVEACQNTVRTGNGEIPQNSPARTAIIETGIGAAPLTPQQEGRIRIGLAEYFDNLKGPDATKGDQQYELGKLMILGVNTKASAEGLKPDWNPATGPIRIRTNSPLEGQQLAGAITMLMGMLARFDEKTDKPLRPGNNPQNNAERQKRIEDLNKQISTLENRNKTIDAELARPTTGPNALPADQRTKLTQEKAKNTEQIAKMRQEIAKLQSDTNNATQNRRDEIGRTLKANNDRLTAINNQLNGTPPPNPPLTPEQTKKLTEEKTKLEEQNKNLNAELEKLGKDGNVPPNNPPNTPPTPGEGPRLAPTEANRKALNEASTKAVTAYNDAKTSGTNKQLIVTNNTAAQAALNNELAHLQEYGAPSADMNTRMGEIQKTLGELRASQVVEGGNKVQADVEAAERLPDNTPELRRVKLDALIPAHRARLAVARAALPDAAPSSIAITNLETALTALIRERAAIGPVNHTEANRKALTDATTKANENRTSLMASRGGPDRSGPAILRAFDETYAAAEAELAHLNEYATPDAPMNARIGVLTALTRSLQLDKKAEITTQLRDASDRAEALPRTNDAERVTRYTTMITTNSAELAHLQQTGGDAARITALQDAIAASRRSRAQLAPVPT